MAGNSSARLRPQPDADLLEGGAAQRRHQRQGAVAGAAARRRTSRARRSRRPRPSRRPAPRRRAAARGSTGSPQITRATPGVRAAAAAAAGRESASAASGTALTPSRLVDQLPAATITASLSMTSPDGAHARDIAAFDRDGRSDVERRAVRAWPRPPAHGSGRRPRRGRDCGMCRPATASAVTAGSRRRTSPASSSACSTPRVAKRSGGPLQLIRLVQASSAIWSVPFRSYSTSSSAVDA